MPALDLVETLVSDTAGDAVLTARTVETFLHGTFVRARPWFLDDAAYAASTGHGFELSEA